MTLQPGTHLGHYDVTAKLGEGGMGEVWRARDTKLDRDVALKVLPQAFTEDPERLARFEREAKVLASLNHPNIAAIYGLEDSGETHALVLELVEGPTLADRIAQGAIPLDEALPIAKQIAEALEAAHEHSVIHRDLKPANIKVTPEGVVKVLDFGLAKALEPEGSEEDAANSPTMTAAATRMGVILGTAAYMSPEQAKGKTVDKRADIWAFGCVLFEMLTGQRAFPGEDVSESLAAVIRGEPEWAALPGDTPALIRRLLRRCLAKDRRKRLRDSGDALVEIDETLTTPASDTAGVVVEVHSRGWQRPMPWVAGVVIGSIVTGFAVWMILTRPAPVPSAPVTRMSIVMPPTQVRTNTGRRGIAISPTGTHVVYVANEQLYVRALDEFEARPLAGTEGSAPRTPFFSPDGQWIGFHASRDGALKKVALSGFAAETLVETVSPSGASWGADDTIIFGQPGQGVLRVAGVGGTPQVLVSIDLPAVAHQPQMLPGGEAVLFTLARDLGQRDNAQIVVEQVATGERTVLVETGSDARYLPTGHLVYALGGTLLAVPFDVKRRVVTGSPVPVVEGVSRASSTGQAANADVARTGALVYLSGEGASGAARTLVWVDRDGTEEALTAPPRDYVIPRLSPDGTRVALDARDEENDIWIWDLTRETLTPLTVAAGSDNFPVWTPDGRRVVFSSSRDGSPNLYWRAADGTGTVERLAESPTVQFPLTISPDGTRMVIRTQGGGAGMDLELFTLEGERRVERLINTEFDERNAEISPDGHWLAYEWNGSGQTQIYVRPFPNVDARQWPVSQAGGTRPLWGPGGRELFYLTEVGVMGVTVETGADFEAGLPELVVEGRYYGTGAAFSARTYDIAHDGRFLMLKDTAAANPDDPFAGLTQIHIVLNWLEELKRLVPTGQ